MRSRSARRRLKPGPFVAAAVLATLACTGPSKAPSASSRDSRPYAAPAPTPSIADAAAQSAVPDAGSVVQAPKDVGLFDAGEGAVSERICDAGGDGAPEPSAAAHDAAATPPSEPAGVEVPVRGDSPLYVLEGAPDDPRAIVYLHGRCGQVHAVDAFRGAAAEHGTLIALRGDKPCPEQRRRWGSDLDELHKRIQQALRTVKKRRNGVLNTTEVTLFGYSQGAHRAQGLAKRYPRVYPRVVLGGPPTRPSPEHLSKARAIAVFGGDRETTETMQLGAADLVAAGKRAQFFLLPCAGHGEFGPEAERRMSEILSFVSDPAPDPVHDAGSDGS